MSKSPKIVCVVPTCRPQQYESFLAAWAVLFKKHAVTLVTVWDGDEPEVQFGNVRFKALQDNPWSVKRSDRDLFCRRSDVVRNLGFVVAATLDPDYVLTLDDDVAPLLINADPYPAGYDPIRAHLDVLSRRVPLSWMNTAHDTDLYLRGVPYGVRDEAPVMLSHGVWVGTPDFDGETQLRLETGQRVPYSLPYYVGPVPRGVLFPVCGMNVMVRRDALPLLYFAPMGPDSRIPDLHRFGDIWMGVYIKREFDRLGWACHTGASTVLHTRASDARKNVEQERLGRAWNEKVCAWDDPPLPGDLDPMRSYFRAYADKRQRYADLIRSVLTRAA